MEWLVDIDDDFESTFHVLFTICLDSIKREFYRKIGELYEKQKNLPIGLTK